METSESHYGLFSFLMESCFVDDVNQNCWLVFLLSERIKAVPFLEGIAANLIESIDWKSSEFLDRSRFEQGMKKHETNEGKKNNAREY